jgi:hypothetical protein
MSLKKIEEYETRVSTKYFDVAGIGMNLGDLRAIVAACEGLDDSADIHVSGLTKTSEDGQYWLDKMRVRMLRNVDDPA